MSLPAKDNRNAAVRLGCNVHQVCYAMRSAYV